MSTLVGGAHPIELIATLRARANRRLTLSFSCYFYQPQSPFDRRERFSVDANDVSRAWLDQRFSRLQPGWDLALDSVVHQEKGGARHLPMIDFATGQLGRAEFIHLRRVLGERRLRNLEFFASGRSFHAYGLELLKPKEWIEFMGRLLLLNLPGQPPLVDSRWIGHRLMAGYSALRWSANSAHYVGLPARVAIPVASSDIAVRADASTLRVVAREH